MEKNFDYLTNEELDKMLSALNDVKRRRDEEEKQKIRSRFFGFLHELKESPFFIYLRDEYEDRIDIDVLLNMDLIIE